jgi:hypothetical protein
MGVRNFFRAILLTLTRGRLASAPISGPAARYYLKLSWASASFALLSEIAMVMHGGQLKRREYALAQIQAGFEGLFQNLKLYPVSTGCSEALWLFYGASTASGECLPIEQFGCGDR